MPSLRTGLALVLALFALTRVASAQVSPFERIDFDGERIIVTVMGERAELVTLGPVTAAQLVDGAKRYDRDRWRKRIAEDLLDVFDSMGVQLPSRDAIDVCIRRDDGDVITLQAVPMTIENRQAIWKRLTQESPALEEVVELIKQRHAYASLRGIDLDEAALEERARLGDDPTLDQFRLAARRLVCRLGDGHASVSGWRRGLPEGELPIVLDTARGGVVAVEADRSTLIDPRRPYLVSIDGVPVHDWMEAARPYVAAGSPQFVRESSLYLVRRLNFLRRERGLPTPESARLLLRDAHGEDQAEVEVRLEREPDRPVQWPRTWSRRLPRCRWLLPLAQDGPNALRPRARRLEPTDPRRTRSRHTRSTSPHHRCAR